MESWLDVLCDMLPQPGDGIVVSVDGSDCGPLLAARPGATDASSTLLAAARDVAHSGEALHRDGVFAHPLRNGNVQFAVVAIKLNVDEAQQAVVLHLLQWAERWLQLLLDTPLARSTGVANARDAEQLLRAVLNNLPLQAALMQLADELARRFDCEQLAIAVRGRRGLGLRAMAHGIPFDARNRSAQDRLDAMTRAGSNICIWPTPDTSRDSPLASLAASQGDHARLAAPLGVTASVLLERSPDRPFTPEEIDDLKHLGALLGPALALKEQQHSLVPPRLAAAYRDVLDRLFGPGHSGFKTGAIAVLLAALFLGVVEGTYRVRAEAEIEGLVQRAVVAPFDGFIAEANFRAGDTVASGEVIARMEDRELLLELSQSEREEDKLDNEYRKALASADRAEARIVQAQLAQVQAQTRLLREKLQRVQLGAPIDGMLISGDLSRSLGAPVERGDVLFEVAPLDAYRLVLDIEERDIARVTPGLAGVLTLTALPNQRFGFVVERVSPVFLEQEGRVIYRTEADVDGDTALLRPGMAGIGKIDIGGRSYGWILFHRFTDWLRLKLWLWLP